MFEDLNDVILIKLNSLWWISTEFSKSVQYNKVSILRRFSLFQKTVFSTKQTHFPKYSKKC